MNQATPAICQIQRATAGDGAEILTLQKLAYQSEARVYQDQALPPLTQTLESLLGEISMSVVLKATLDGRIVGSVRAAARDGTCHIGRLIVQPQWQGRGIGTQLMRQIEREFPQTHKFELFTGSRSAGNIRLYERLGYARVREQRLSPAITLVFMEKLR